MKKLIFWSGGFDSTAVILHCIKNNIDFDTAYINLQNNESKVECEKSSRERIKDMLKLNSLKDYKDYEFGPFEFIGTGDLTNPWQPIIWLCGFFSGYRYNFKDLYDEILFGYIRGDDFWHYKENFISMFRLMSTHFNIDPLKLKFPLEWVSKTEVYNDYYNTTNSSWKDLIWDIWTCENPYKTQEFIQSELFETSKIRSCTISNNYEPCGICACCKSFEKMLIELGIFKINNGKKSVDVHIEITDKNSKLINSWLKKDIYGCKLVSEKVEDNSASIVKEKILEKNDTVVYKDLNAGKTLIEFMKYVI